MCAYLLQLNVAVADARNPQRIGYGVITVNVQRDDFLPTISPSIIDGFVSENENVGTSVAAVAAFDQDINEDREVKKIPHLFYVVHMFQ